MSSIEEQPSIVPDVAEPDGISTADSKKYFARNTIVNLIYFVFNAGTSLYMVRFLVRHLGIANYGMVGVTNAFVSYTLVLTGALVGSTFRFVAMNLARNDREQARSYANTNLIASLVFAAALLPISIAVSYFAPSILVVPAGQEDNTRLLSMGVYIAFLFGLIGSTYQVAAQVKQRFDIRNLLDIVNQIFRYSTWLILFAVVAPQLWIIGLGYVIGSGVALWGTILVVKKLMSDIAPALKGFDKHKLIEMAKMGKWIGLDQLGTMLYWSTDMIVINLMLGPSSTGKYGIVLGFAVMLRGLSSMMASIVSPIIIAFYARQEWDTMLTSLTRAVKFMSLGLAVPLGIFSGLAVPFLTLWLGPSFAPLYILVWLMISHQVVNSATEPVGAVLLAANKVTGPCVATIVGGVMKVALSIALIKYTDWGIAGVAVAGLITFTLKHLVFTPVYAGRVLSMSSWRIYRGLVPGTVVFAGIAAATLGIAHRFDLTTLPPLAGAALGLCAAGALAIYYLALNDQDRRFLAEVAPWRKRA